MPAFSFTFYSVMFFDLCLILSIELLLVSTLTSRPSMFLSKNEDSYPMCDAISCGCCFIMGDGWGMSCMEEYKPLAADWLPL